AFGQVPRDRISAHDSVAAVGRAAQANLSLPAGASAAIQADHQLVLTGMGQEDAGHLDHDLTAPQVAWVSAIGRDPLGRNVQPTVRRLAGKGGNAASDGTPFTGA